MSSGSSVFSIIPPKRARTERFILVQSPISAQPPKAKCESLTLVAPVRIAALLAPRNVLLYDTYVQAVSCPGNCLRSITALFAAFHRSRGASDVAPELHARPTDSPKRVVTNVESTGQIRGGSGHT